MDLKKYDMEVVQDDKEIVSRVLAGDKKCFEILVNRYKKPLLKVIFRIIGDYDASLDILQETFLRAWKYLKSYRSEQKFSSWLFKIATNLSRDYHKSYKKDREKEKKLGNKADTCRWEDVKDNKIYVTHILKGLKEPYRTAIVLRFIKDFKYDEIAHIMEVTTEQVKNYLFRGRKYLLEILREEENYEI